MERGSAVGASLRGSFCPQGAAHGGAGDGEIVTASRRRRSRSVALRWCRSALAATRVPANAGLGQVGATGGDNRVGDVRAIRAKGVFRVMLAEIRRA